MREAVAAWRDAVSDRTCAPVVRTEGDAGAVRWDRRAIRHILGRLLDNAEQHTPPPHEVEVEVRPDGRDAIAITVRDHGTGIPADLLERALLPFFPQHRGRPGLGLTVADKLTRALAGRLTIASEEGVGTEVRVVLPRDEPAG